MKIACIIHTPGQAHFWSNIIRLLENNGHLIAVMARDDGMTLELLAKYGVKNISYGKSDRTKLGKLIQLPYQFLRCLNVIRKFMPDIIVGTGVIEGVTSALIRKACIIFEDTEITPYIERIQWKFLASVIITPSCFLKNFGKKHIRIEGYKELAYLHPNYFRPDPKIYDELKINSGEKFVVLRFNNWNAIHDIGNRGFSLKDKYELTRELQKYCRVFISAEEELPPDLSSYILPVKQHRIHQVLYYSSLYVGDGGTMAVEAALLGIPTVHFECNYIKSRKVDASKIYGNFDELANKYHLIQTYSDSREAINAALTLVKNPEAKLLHQKLKDQVLKDKIDVTAFMVKFIEEYPKSQLKSGKRIK